MLNLPKTSLTDWLYRLVPSRFPTVSLFDYVEGDEELAAVAELHGYSNDRLREEIGLLNVVPREQRRYGPGWTPVMAAFTHLGYANRFSAGDYGVYYAATKVAVALNEAAFHRERLLAASNEPPSRLTMRSYRNTAAPGTEFGSINHESHPHCLDPDPAQYAPAQALASEWRATGEAGLLYPSVRSPGGQCVAVFRPDALTRVIQCAHYELLWDGNAISERYELRSV